MASICNAVMDKTNHHFNRSIFNKLNPKWWNGEISWRNKYVGGDVKDGRVKWVLGLNKPVQLTDAFHFFKMLMIVFMVLAIVTFPSVEYFSLNMFYLICGYGLAWNLTFSFFYHKIFTKRVDK